MEQKVWKSTTKKVKTPEFAKAVIWWRPSWKIQMAAMLKLYLCTCNYYLVIWKNYGDSSTNNEVIVNYIEKKCHILGENGPFWCRSA